MLNIVNIVNFILLSENNCIYIKNAFFDKKLKVYLTGSLKELKLDTHEE